MVTVGVGVGVGVGMGVGVGVGITGVKVIDPVRAYCTPKRVIVSLTGSVNVGAVGVVVVVNVNNVG